MTTDTNPIVSLPPCGRRMLLTNPNGTQLFCKPPPRPEGMSSREFIRSRRVKKRRVTTDDCLACQAMTPSVPRPTSSPTPEDAIGLVNPHEEHADAPDASQVDEKGSPAVPTVHPDGSLVYEKEGWEPPPCPPGYHRKSEDLKSDDAWILLRDEPLCKHAILRQVHRASCSCIRIIPTCQYNGQSVDISIGKCEECFDKESRDG